MKTLIPIHPDEIIEYCFKSNKEIEDRLLKAYRKRNSEDGSITNEFNDFEVKIFENILHEKIQNPTK